MKDHIFNAAQDGYVDYLIAIDDEPATFLRALRNDLNWSDEDASEVEVMLRAMIAASDTGLNRALVVASRCVVLRGPLAGLTGVVIGDDGLRLLLRLDNPTGTCLLVRPELLTLRQNPAN